MNVLVLSDLHLGTRASRCHRLLTQLPELCRQYDRVILNGDTVDRYEAPGCTPQAEHWLHEARRACASRYGPPELVAGNHDPAISDLHWVYLERTQTLVFHGDCISDCTHPTKPSDRRLAIELGRRWEQLGQRPRCFKELAPLFREIQGAQLRADPPPEVSYSPLYYLYHVLMPPKKPFDILRYWHSAPRKLASLAATFDEPVRNVVVGHTHHPGHWVIDGINVYNTGSFMPLSLPYALTVDGNQVRMRRLAGLLGGKAVRAEALAEVAREEGA